MVAKSTATKKEKARRHQTGVAERIRAALSLPDEDVVPRPMGSPGIDIMLSDRAREQFPYGIECKRVETLSIPSWWKQCEKNAEDEGLKPMLIFRKNREPNMVVMRFDDFMEAIK